MQTELRQRKWLRFEICTTGPPLYTTRSELGLLEIDRVAAVSAAAGVASWNLSPPKPEELPYPPSPMPGPGVNKRICDMESTPESALCTWTSRECLCLRSTSLTQFLYLTAGKLKLKNILPVHDQQPIRSACPMSGSFWRQSLAWLSVRELHMHKLEWRRRSANTDEDLPR